MFPLLVHSSYESTGQSAVGDQPVAPSVRTFDGLRYRVSAVVTALLRSSEVLSFDGTVEYSDAGIIYTSWKHKGLAICERMSFIPCVKMCPV
jgi:hypothetical protein